MKIIDFTEEWMTKAAELVLEEYQQERSFVPVLPERPRIPDLAWLAKNGLGVAAVEGERLLGFLSACGPWKPVFCTRDVSGVFSPANGHAAIREDRGRIYQRLYQAASEKWVRAGAASHTITFYAHDTDGQNALFRFGFGMRCMDLIRDISEITAPEIPGLRIIECKQSNQLLPLRTGLVKHFSDSPMFMHHTAEDLQQFLARRESDPPRTFAAEMDGRLVAYIEICEEGEHFCTGEAAMANICGAYCLPEYRGTGITQWLLSKMIRILTGEGITRVGVDCESINPAAAGFWRKYFAEYTHSLVRRIDENALMR